MHVVSCEATTSGIPDVSDVYTCNQITGDNFCICSDVLSTLRQDNEKFFKVCHLTLFYDLLARMISSETNILPCTVCVYKVRLLVLFSLF